MLSVQTPKCIFYKLLPYFSDEKKIEKLENKYSYFNRYKHGMDVTENTIRRQP